MNFHRPLPDRALPVGAGRVCPGDYTYAPAVFTRAADFTAETLYVVGGLYGNLAALAAIEKMAAAKRAQLVFNGDFHWFDAEPEWFADVERRVMPYAALRGNVETELARARDIGVGCGCAYPETVGEDTVRRSNEILAELSGVAPEPSSARLRRLPMHLVAQVGRLRIGIVHGDAVSLAGWRFAPDALDEPRNRSWLADIHAQSRIDVFASTHTCLAALRDFPLPTGRLTVVNNGAAGMPNFAGTPFGVVTRIATTPSPHASLYGLQRDGVHIDALAVAYDQAAFLERFLQRWPPSSPAHASYFRRMTDGPDYAIERAGPP
jgi:predicted phosphodiesterase